MTVRKEILVLVGVALIIAAIFVVHPLIQGMLSTTPERAGVPPQGETDAKEPASPTPSTAN